MRNSTEAEDEDTNYKLVNKTEKTDLKMQKIADSLQNFMDWWAED